MSSRARGDVPAFEVSVICKSPAEKQEYPLPPGVKLYHYHKDATMGEKIRNLFGCLLDGNYYRSVFGKEHAKGSWRAREAEVRNFRLSAHLFRKYLRDEGFFDRIEHTIYYSYGTITGYGACIGETAPPADAHHHAHAWL